MTSQPQPQFRISAPFSMTLQPDSSGTFQVVNTGTQPLSVHGALGRYSHGALTYPAADHATTVSMGSPWVSFSPAHFVLAPGHAQAVHVTDRVPSGVTGGHSIDIVWSAQPVHAVGGPLHLAGAVASTITIPGPGVAVPVTGPGHLAAPVPGHMGGGGLSTLDAGTAGIGFIVAAVAVTAVWRRRRARRHTGAHRKAA
jgi:hypothetical protein